MKEFRRRRSVVSPGLLSSQNIYVPKVRRKSVGYARHHGKRTRTPYTQLASLLLGVGTAVFAASLPLYVSGERDSETTKDETLIKIESRLRDAGSLNRAQSRVLAEELNRVRQYESALKRKVAALDAVMQDVLQLDYYRFEVEGTAEPEDPELELGVGGGAEPIAPLYGDTPIDGEEAEQKISALERPLTAHIAKSNLPELLEFQTEELSRLPLGAPTKGKLSSRYGHRRSPFTKRRQMHKGMDFAVDRKSAVVATAEGVVKKAGYYGAYGRTVVIDHGNGYETLYGHLSKIEAKVGDTICRGQRLGLVGSTGRSTGPHVHYEVRKNGKPMNPAPFVELATFVRFI